jgi:hypothetical protein
LADHERLGINKRPFQFDWLEDRIHPDVWIDIEGIHVDITISKYDDQGVLIGYVNFSYGPASGDYFGGPGEVTVSEHGLDWDPNVHHDYRIDTVTAQDRDMMEYAEDMAENPPDYNLLLGNTCVGKTTDILEAGGIDGPWYVGDPWSGAGYDDWLEDWIPDVTALEDQDIEGTGSSSSDDSSGASSGNDSGSSGGGGGSSDEQDGSGSPSPSGSGSSDSSDSSSSSSDSSDSSDDSSSDSSTSTSSAAPPPCLDPTVC